jgi:hypothetical protein
MFERAKARIKKLEEDHESIRNAKKHVEKHKVVYASVGASVTTAIVMKVGTRPQIITVIQEVAAPALPSIINNNMPVFNNDNSSSVNFGGHVTKMVERVDDGKIWKKVKLLAEEVAEENNVSFETARVLLSRHLNGYIPDVYGVEYKPVGLGTTG